MWHFKGKEILKRKVRSCNIFVWFFILNHQAILLPIFLIRYFEEPGLWQTSGIVKASLEPREWLVEEFYRWENAFGAQFIGWKEDKIWKWWDKTNSWENLISFISKKYIYLFWHFKDGLQFLFRWSKTLFPIKPRW